MTANRTRRAGGGRGTTPSAALDRRKPMSTSPVLVIARDVVVGALLASMAELAGYAPVFPEGDERPLEAITRLCPTVVLLDCDHDVACEDEAYARAAEIGCRVILFSAMRSQLETEALALRRGVTAFALPIRYHEFATKIGPALSPSVDPSLAPDTSRRSSHRQ